MGSIPKTRIDMRVHRLSFLPYQKQDSVIKWLLLAPPNDKVKNAKARKWMKENKGKVAVIRKQLEKQGLL
ncbi:MAG: hypothetical protein E4H14_13785 [Candidatus Thorarchaeota archaeon]|nr:MAG: hypothetical protein E4H14_13785 [Candidatus Thorarchaeota archaeon]